MKERPILMHARSINGILEGRKTQTRRIVKKQPPWRWAVHRWVTDILHEWMYQIPAIDRHQQKCPFGQPGDRLWVREAWRVRADQDDIRPSDLPHHTPWYCATGNGQGDEEPSGCAGGLGKKRLAMFMPRWASRLTLGITRIRVERVQDISVADCMAEGIIQIPHGILRVQVFGLPDWPKERYKMDAREVFGELWDETNGKGAWERNDWVWVVDFKRTENAKD